MDNDKQEVIDVVLGILGACTCHESYKIRGKEDPNCQWHQHSYDFIKALSAERTKREIAEKKVKNLESFLDNDADWFYEQEERIKKLEAEATAWASKVGELKDQLATVQKRLKGYEDAPNRLINILDLEMEIATANAKIVELELGRGMRQKEYEEMLQEQLDYINKIKSLESEISTANKKAEKLVEVLEFVLDKISDEKGRNNLDNYILNTTITKAIKEVRGESNG